MKLTKFIRQQIVNDIMSDIPKIDYYSEYKRLIEVEAYDQLPEVIKTIYDSEYREYLDKKYLNYRYHFDGVCIYNNAFDISVIKNKLDKLNELSEKQDSERIKMKVELLGALNSVTTLKAAKEILPEFEKYFPEPDEHIKYKVATNLVSNLKKMGWKSK